MSSLTENTGGEEVDGGGIDDGAGGGSAYGGEENKLVWKRVQLGEQSRELCGRNAACRCEFNFSFADEF